MSRAARRLFLHVSALTDVEYDVYTAALRDVMDLDNSSDVHFDEDIVNQALGLREVRAWMKGRYQDVNQIDKILKLFCPDLGPQDAITVGQFFAALRLVMHSRTGCEISEDRIFVQPSPSILTDKWTPQLLQVEVSSQNYAHVPRPSPPRSRTVSMSPAIGRTNGIPYTDTTQGDGNDRIIESSFTSDRTAVPGPSSNLPKSSHNPFLQRSKTIAGASSDNSPTKNIVTVISDTKAFGRIPPLPPRKPQSISLGTPLQPANNGLITVPPFSPSLKSAAKDKPPPPPPHPIATSALMNKSLLASKAGKSLKKAQEQLEKERVLEVIRSSSLSPSGPVIRNGRTRSSSPTKVGSQVRRPVPSPPRSVADTIASLDQVANATLNLDRSHSPDVASNTSSSSQASNSRPVSDIPAAPPTHPKRRSMLTQSASASTEQEDAALRDGSPSPRASRSMSMRLPSGSKPTPPPRRRPESIQVQQQLDDDKALPNPSPSYLSSDISRPPLSASFSHGHSQSLSHLSSTYNNDSRMESHLSSGIQNAFSQLQAKTQPAFDRARIKMEAGLAPRRGFIFHGSGSGVHADESEAKLVGTSVDDLEVDSEVERSSSDDDHFKMVGRNNIMRHDQIDRDNLKLPSGDGWAPL